MSLQIFKKVFKRNRCLFVFSFLLCSSPLPSLWALEIPTEWARVSKEFQGENGKTLILIQEAHVDYACQKAILEILKSLIQKESLRLILLEGGWEDLGLSHLRNLADLKGRLKVAERYLKEGKISAAEYLDLASDFTLSLWGIEKPQYYEENMKAFLALHDEQEKLLGELLPLENMVHALKEKMLPPPLQEFEKARQDFEEEKISLLDYLQFLVSREAHAFLLDSFPYLRNLVSLTGREAGFDPEKIEWEKQGLIKVLSKKLTKPELEKIQILKDRKSPEEELEFLESLLQLYDSKFPKKNPKAVSTANLIRYAQILRSMMSAHPDEIFKEIKKLEDQIVASYPLTPDQETLLQMASSIRILKKLFNLQLGPDEFEVLQKESFRFKVVAWRDFLENKIKETGVSLPPLFPDLEKVEKGLPLAKAFYESALKREEALVENAVQRIAEEKNSLVALIVGGYHAKEMVEALKKRGYSIFLVSPRFTPEDSAGSGARYFEILKHNWSGGIHG